MTKVEESYYLWPDENDIEGRIEVTLEVEGDKVPEVFKMFQRSLQALSDEFKLGYHGVEVVSDE